MCINVTDFCRPDATSTNHLKALKVILTMNKYQSNLAKGHIVYLSPLATAMDSSDLDPS